MSNIMYNESNKLQIENKLEEIFNRYTNDDFEHLVPVAFVYKRTIKFVPVELSEEVKKLLTILEEIEQSKTECSSKAR